MGADLSRSVDLADAFETRSARDRIGDAEEKRAYIHYCRYEIILRPAAAAERLSWWCGCQCARQPSRLP